MKKYATAVILFTLSSLISGFLFIYMPFLVPGAAFGIVLTIAVFGFYKQHVQKPWYFFTLISVIAWLAAFCIGAGSIGILAIVSGAIGALILTNGIRIAVQGVYVSGYYVLSMFLGSVTGWFFMDIFKRVTQSYDFGPFTSGFLLSGAFALWQIPVGLSFVYVIERALRKKSVAGLEKRLSGPSSQPEINQDKAETTSSRTLYISIGIGLAVIIGLVLFIDYMGIN